MSSAVGITSNTVPWEILRAAGLSPQLLEADAGPTPHADRYMEPVFDRRFRVIFDRLCGGAWNNLSSVVISRASEQEHKLYLYLREISREHGSAQIPNLYLYNLLHTRTPASYDYGLVRTRQMARDFQVSDLALADAIAESNQARSALRELQRKREAGLLDGLAAIEMIAGFYAGDRGGFAKRTLARLLELNGAALRSRPRILLKGAPLDGAELHSVVEQAGGYVVAEDDWRGSRAGGSGDVRTDADPVTAIFEKYFFDEVSPRVQPLAQRDDWFHGKIEAGIADAVLFYIPSEDDVVGWDYPRQRAWLDDRKIPHCIVRDLEPSIELETFLKSVERL